MGFVDSGTVQRVELIMKGLGLSFKDRSVVVPARESAAAAEANDKGNEGIFCGAAIELKNGDIVTGKNSSLMHATASLVFNAVKQLANIPDKIHLLSPEIITSIKNLKKSITGVKVASLNLEEALIALSIGAMTNHTAQLAMGKLSELNGCEMHITHMPTPGDESGLRKLGVNLTSDPNFSSKSLFVV